MTVPKLLAEQGCESALFGKFHLCLQGHNPAGYGLPHNLGWNYFGQAVPVPKLDKEGSELPLDALTDEQQRNLGLDCQPD